MFSSKHFLKQRWSFQHSFHNWHFAMSRYPNTVSAMYLYHWLFDLYLDDWLPNMYILIYIYTYIYNVWVIVIVKPQVALLELVVGLLILRIYYISHFLLLLYSIWLGHVLLLMIWMFHNWHATWSPAKETPSSSTRHLPKETNSRKQTAETPVHRFDWPTYGKALAFVTLNLVTSVSQLCGQVLSRYAGGKKWDIYQSLLVVFLVIIVSCSLSTNHC